MEDITDEEWQEWIATCHRLDDGHHAELVLAYAGGDDSPSSAVAYFSAEFGQRYHPGKPCIWCPLICETCESFGAIALVAALDSFRENINSFLEGLNHGRDIEQDGSEEIRHSASATE